MKHLLYIRVPFKKAIKKGYPIYVTGENKLSFYTYNNELKREEQQYILSLGVCKTYYDINGKNKELKSILYSKIPLIYSNIGCWIIGFIMASILAFLTQVKLTGNPIHLYILIIVFVTWVNLFEYWQKDKLDKWIIEQFNK